MYFYVKNNQRFHCLETYCYCNMRYLFFDTETTGLPKDMNAPYQSIDNWPRLVQIAWLIYNDRELVSKNSFIVRPQGYIIPIAASNVHGITNQEAFEKGSPVKFVLERFLSEAKGIDVIIGHNVDYDIKVVKSELYRLDLDGEFNTSNVIDTMVLSVDFCELPHPKHGYRYPRLIELYEILFSESFDNMHNAMADIEATARCFWRILDMGLIDKKEYSFLLSAEEKKELAKQYEKKAYELMCSGKLDSTSKAEKLYLQSAKLGSTEGMFKVALLNMGDISKKDYSTAKYWLEEIVRLSKTQPVHWYKQTLEYLIRINREQGNSILTNKYQQLLDNHLESRKIELLNNPNLPEPDFKIMVQSYFDGSNGFPKDKERAYQLMREGINKGYRSLYSMYSSYLKDIGDEDYFYYLIEDVKDTEKQIGVEFKQLKDRYGLLPAIEKIKFHKSLWLLKPYRLIAEAYLTGFGVDKSVEKALSFLSKAFGCSSGDHESTILSARLYNGEFGEEYIDYDKSIRMLKALPLENMENKYPYALLGDAYFGKSTKNYSIAKIYYDAYPGIENYKSPNRSLFCKYSSKTLFRLFH